MTEGTHGTSGAGRARARAGDVSTGSSIRRFRLVAATATIGVVGLALLVAGVASGRWQLLGAAACWLAAAAAAFWALRAVPAGDGSAGRGRLGGRTALCLALLVAGTVFVAQLG